MEIKLVVLYPRPRNIEVFGTVYRRDHVPMAVEKLAGKTKIGATKVVGSPLGMPAFHRIAEIHVPSTEALAGCGKTDDMTEFLLAARFQGSFEGLGRW